MSFLLFFISLYPQQTFNKFSLHLPDILQRNLELFKCVDNLLHLSPVIIAPPALVIAKGEILLHGGQSNGADLIVLGDFSLGRARIEGQVNATAESTPGELFGASDNFLSVGISEEDSMGVGNIVLGAVDLVTGNGSLRTVL